jgi:CheY-like chemotaxis protein
MASSSVAASFVNWRGAIMGLALLLCYSPAQATKRIALAELAQRNSVDSAPAALGQEVTISGVVSTSAFHVLNYELVPMQDDSFGAILKAVPPETSLEGLHAGDDIEVQGIIGIQFGMTIVQPESILIRGHKKAPEPIDVSPRDLQHFIHLGRLVRVEGKIIDDFYNSGGAVVMLGSPKSPYKIFVPQGPGKPQPDLNRFLRGDSIRAVGIALQYCPTPPYNTGWELMVANTNDITTIARSSTVPPPYIGGGIVVALVTGFLFWSRERRLRSQRKKLRRTYQLAEEILSASSPLAILQRLSESLPTILGINRVRLYVHNRAAKTLESVVDEHGVPASISLSSPPGGTPAGAVACLHYRTLLVIPDIDRSPFPISGNPGERTPKSLLFVPMMAQNEVVGVLELDQDDRVRDFSADVQALAQHLGNQIGVAIRLMDRRSVQEQLFRTEKLAAIGRLISSVVNELQTPLAHIKDLAHKALEKTHGSSVERDMSAIATEAGKASSMVSRLISFAAAEQVEARAVDVAALLVNLIEFRESDWKASGIRVRNLVPREPMLVLGAHGQLEQVFLNLLVHAEQSLARAEQKTITIRASLLAKRLLVEISFTSPAELRTPEDTAAVLGVTRSVIGGHGGEVRLIEKNNSDPRFEVELPAAVRERSSAAPVSVHAPTPAAAAPRDSSRRLTALVIEPDEPDQRQLLALLSARGFRVVPVSNTDAALDMAQRMRFDAAFCSLHAPGLNWVELSERMHARVSGFILLSDGYDAELTNDFEGDGRFVLPKPVQEDELERILRSMEPKGATIIPFKTGIA